MEQLHVLIVNKTQLATQNIPFERFKYTDSYTQSNFGEMLSVEKEQGRFAVVVTEDDIDLLSSLLKGLFA